MLRAETMTSHAAADAPRFSVAFEGPDGPTLLAHRVSLAEATGLVLSHIAPELGAVVPRLAARLGAQASAPWPDGAGRAAWLRAALVAEAPPEAEVARGLGAPSVEERTVALEAAWLAMSPATLGLVRERAAVEPDERLRRHLATTVVALLAPHAPDAEVTATAVRKAWDLRAARRLEGLTELAASETPAELRAQVREVLGDVHRSADDRDARFVAGLLGWLEGARP